MSEDFLWQQNERIRRARELTAMKRDRESATMPTITNLRIGRTVVLTPEEDAELCALAKVAGPKVTPDEHAAVLIRNALPGTEQRILDAARED